MQIMRIVLMVLACVSQTACMVEHLCFRKTCEMIFQT